MQPEILHNNPTKHFVVAILYKSCARTLQSAEFNMRQEKLPVNSIFCHVGCILLLLLQKTRGAMRANVNRLPVCSSQAPREKKRRAIAEEGGAFKFLGSAVIDRMLNQ